MGNKWGVNEQDQEDFDQEKLIQEWARANGHSIDLPSISSKGTARNTLIKASISLDQKIQNDSSGTFADIIAGSDGRYLLSRGFADVEEIEPIEIIEGYLNALGFIKGEIACLVKILKSSILTEATHSEKSAIDSEW